MKIAVAKEIEVGERRVALIPDMVKRLVGMGVEVLVEAQAGAGSFFTDEAYVAAGATIVKGHRELLGAADLVLKVSPPGEWEDGQSEVDLLPENTTLIGFLHPLGKPEMIAKLAERNITALSMELVPRTTRAQSMDALSSQASVAGYQAVLLGAEALPRFLPMLTTAAGTIRPAKVFVIGAGVAGLQAIATARRLGAVVEAFDIRPAVKEEVQSLGAKFVEVTMDEETVAEGGYAREISEDSKERSRQVVAEHVQQADIVITTAQVPGKHAPLLVTQEMVESMKPGSVIVDLAAEQGGNCACTEAGRTVITNEVTILGPINLASYTPVHSSQMYSKNILNLLTTLIQDGEMKLNFEDDIISSVCLTHQGEVRNARVQGAIASLQEPSAT
ncbi:Re/Si-specific NAD(P)(+) transhydrogenase subunit alpha [Vacuolonema iberomarrocanum]|uniref:Re/Si-specific NAD(P)(+) transhydrogenase subunit alpha n=1 Tax=Vacuolonema iberomarrocanum TaxID=3454632 RepID=UPI0019DE2650|nr:Re/Si-specific NAD(P)(+) transhydrogenase subunit alpha [filamentous cyanobacterium LEGE 07170]